MTNSFPIKSEMYLHSGKDDNAYHLETLMKEKDVVFDEDAQRAFLYAGYEVELNILINQNGFAYATHVNGVKLEQPVKI